MYDIPAIAPITQLVDPTEDVEQVAGPGDAETVYPVMPEDGLGADQETVTDPAARTAFGVEGAPGMTAGGPTGGEMMSGGHGLTDTPAVPGLRPAAVTVRTRTE